MDKYALVLIASVLEGLSRQIENKGMDLPEEADAAFIKDLAAKCMDVSKKLRQIAGFAPFSE